MHITMSDHSPNTTRRDPETSPYPCLCAMVRKAGRVLTKTYDRHLKPCGLKITQYSMLANIAGCPDITVSELANRLLMDQTTVTRNLRVLDNAGYIRLQPDVADQRIKRIQLTDKGKLKISEARPLWEKAQIEMEQTLGRKDVDILIGSLQKIG